MFSNPVNIQDARCPLSNPQAQAFPPSCIECSPLHRVMSCREVAVLLSYSLKITFMLVFRRSRLSLSSQRGAQVPKRL